MKEFGRNYYQNYVYFTYTKKLFWSSIIGFMTLFTA